MKVTHKIYTNENGVRVKKCKKCLEIKTIDNFQYIPTTKNRLKAQCRVCLAKESKRYRELKGYHNKRYRQNLKKRYGITPEYYDEMLKSQYRSCAICGRHENEFTRRLHVDHNHSTGKVRGLLCTNCNTMLGKSFDNIDILIKAVKYLNETNGECK